MEIDQLNALFEVSGGLFVLMNVIKLHKDKVVRGVSKIAVLFFMVWGWFNLVYYPSLEQWWSTIGALPVALANTIWLGQIIYYLRKEKYGNRRICTKDRR